jgi:hypothetical protein
MHMLDSCAMIPHLTMTTMSSSPYLFFFLGALLLRTSASELLRSRNLLSEKQIAALELDTGMAWSGGPYIVNGDVANTSQVPWFV